MAIDRGSASQTSALTLTFSPGEREQRLFVFRFLMTVRRIRPLEISKQRRMFLPLRSRGGRGEGRGEVRANVSDLGWPAGNRESLERV